MLRTNTYVGVANDHLCHAYYYLEAMVDRHTRERPGPRGVYRGMRVHSVVDEVKNAELAR